MFLVQQRDKDVGGKMTDDDVEVAVGVAGTGAMDDKDVEVALDVDGKDVEVAVDVGGK